MLPHRHGVALLLTLSFLIVISISLGFVLHEVNKSSELVKREKFLYQSTQLVEDFVHLLQNAPEFKEILDANSATALYALLSQAEFIPLHIGEYELIVSLHSARGKFNPNDLNPQRLEALKVFLSHYMINGVYGDILYDSISSMKEDGVYNTTLFQNHPELFRDYIASPKHLEVLKDFYIQEFHDNSINAIDQSKLFYLSDAQGSAIDLNFATPEVWELLLGSTKERAQELYAGAGSYEKMEDLHLTVEEKRNLSRFKTTLYEPILQVDIHIVDTNESVDINFEYNIAKKEGSHFVYKL